jgi:PAS domain S-box-containing protein
MDKRHSILIVDDDESTCKSLTLIFGKNGCETQTAGTGREAIEKARQKFFNVALLDIKLPDMEGIQLLAPLKEMHPDIVTIMLTGYASVDSAIGALNAGASAYITKPLNMDEVLDRVRDALDKQQLVMENRRLYEEAQQEVAERRRAEEALKASEKKYMGLVENSPDIIFTLTPEGHFGFVGGAVECLTGFTPEDLIGKHFTSIVWPEDTNKAQFHFNERRTEKRATRRLELRLQVKTGKGKQFDIHYLAIELNAFGMYDKPVTEKDKNFLGTYGVARDITARKKVEQALRCSNRLLLGEHKQRKVLAKRLIKLLESDRREVAMELHDHVGQILTTLKMDLEMILREVKSDGAAFKESIQLAHDKALQAMEGIQHIAHGLRPAVLDTLGLVPSLRELFDDIKQHAELEIRFFHKKIPRRFDPEKELAVYRIAQEALTNVVKHAHARKVFVNLVREKEFFTLGVEDDGVGFDKNGVMKISKRKGPLGLLIMRERAVQVDGEFSVESRIGGGTHLFVRIPV